MRASEKKLDLDSLDQERLQKILMNCSLALTDDELVDQLLNYEVSMGF